MHKEFAEVYDVFMKHVDYKGWYKFLKTYIKTKGEVLDLGCGTGEFIYRLLDDGFSVTGEVTSAEERQLTFNDMIEVALESALSL